MARKLISLLIGIGIVVLLWLWLAPPQVWLNWTKRVDLSDPLATGKALVEQYKCQDCHRILDEGALKAPDLSGVTRRLSDQELELWLKDPNTVKKNTAMPDFRLSDTEVTALISYLKASDMKYTYWNSEPVCLKVTTQGR
jgi:cytochrome c2